MIDPDLLDRRLAHAIAQRPEGGAVVALSGNAPVVGLPMAVIPSPTDQNRCAQSRRPMDVMRQGWSMRRFQAWQQ